MSFSGPVGFLTRNKEVLNKHADSPPSLVNIARGDSIALAWFGVANPTREEGRAQDQGGKLLPAPKAGGGVDGSQIQSLFRACG